MKKRNILGKKLFIYIFPRQFFDLGITNISPALLFDQVDPLLLQETAEIFIRQTTVNTFQQIS